MSQRRNQLHWRHAALNCRRRDEMRDGNPVNGMGNWSSALGAVAGTGVIDAFQFWGWATMIHGTGGEADPGWGGR